ncbi:similar to Saccharomyces cerevisiae YLL027W ISA1 Mitochondrial matrix protein involved in biogenesis of the iron-sulfur (Fe/S) cluster of Fe/S proteins [Maudiozyma barnettii]|uniref:Iron-sulfur assembly protein 1 n=1 Tax=Maudiozyma barnettii TaxID=61262 RepID=A0A8H2ZG78_9SACH|nr:Fe-binding Fe/S cluster assembly protein ISA1 [Kazachstania barnettii]CAB4253054.1 similar to Saccharomyces cerevisiae YLL027W ISA1 Mitochondrial matrix protein involved in biogenesis of the iron-sulfur (Fe/S) cluster of Fe/S proteins [Kazachstania barnettii]CAD1780411.1 similar to Saccharomyces cerevisiae YLL027W ISA1 Mitochondrial matrix protein involved in biogenesis of the iron-sulfur (Fe/S) cluster of Fe/S proteins [Kazachstania barnettii]
MLLPSRITSQSCCISISNKLSNILIVTNKKYYSNTQIIRRNNTNLAFNSSTSNGSNNLSKLKFIPNVITANNTDSSTSTSDSNQYQQKDFKFKFINQSQTLQNKDNSIKPSKWSSHALPSQTFLKEQHENTLKEEKLKEEKLEVAKKIIEEAKSNPTSITNETKYTSTSTSTANSTTLKTKKRKRTLRPRKAIITLSPKAILHLKALLDQPNPQMIRVGTRNRGCSGTTYDLQYISEPGKFDEIIEQDGVKVVIDSKALFSVVGSEMDWVDEKLQSKFVFKNPNSKGTCGCGESFMV